MVHKQCDQLKKNHIKRKKQTVKLQKKNVAES